MRGNNMLIARRIVTMYRSTMQMLIVVVVARIDITVECKPI